MSKSLTIDFKGSRAAQLHPSVFNLGIFITSKIMLLVFYSFDRFNMNLESHLCRDSWFILYCQDEKNAEVLQIYVFFLVMSIEISLFAFPDCDA